MHHNMKRVVTYPIKFVALLIISMCGLQAMQGFQCHAIEIDSCSNKPNVATLPDSTIRRLVRELDMIDSTGVSYRLEKRKNLRMNCLPLLTQSRGMALPIGTRSIKKRASCAGCVWLQNRSLCNMLEA